MGGLWEIIDCKITELAIGDFEGFKVRHGVLSKFIHFATINAKIFKPLIIAQIVILKIVGVIYFHVAKGWKIAVVQLFRVPESQFF